MPCIFCEIDSERIIDQNKLFIVVQDAYPVTPGHILIIPKRHAQTWFELTAEEHQSLSILLQKHKIFIEHKDKQVTGFNIGMNCGETAGQTVGYAHVHLIPRRKGDVVNPRGGVRSVIPNKADWTSQKTSRTNQNKILMNDGKGVVKSIF